MRWTLVLAQGRCPGREGRGVSSLGESRVYTGGSHAGAWMSLQLNHPAQGRGCGSKVWASGPAPRGDAYSGVRVGHLQLCCHPLYSDAQNLAPAPSRMIWTSSCHEPAPLGFRAQLRAWPPDLAPAWLFPTRLRSLPQGLREPVCLSNGIPRQLLLPPSSEIALSGWVPRDWVFCL